MRPNPDAFRYSFHHHVLGTLGGSCSWQSRRFRCYRPDKATGDVFGVSGQKIIYVNEVVRPHLAEAVQVIQTVIYPVTGDLVWLA